MYVLDKLLAICHSLTIQFFPNNCLCVGSSKSSYQLSQSQFLTNFLPQKFSCMYVCMYVCMYICAYTHTFMYIYACTYYIEHKVVSSVTTNHPFCSNTEVSINKHQVQLNTNWRKWCYKEEITTSLVCILQHTYARMYKCVYLRFRNTFVNHTH